jgi:hypothetical protein
MLNEGNQIRKFILCPLRSVIKLRFWFCFGKELRVRFRNVAGFCVPYLICTVYNILKSMSSSSIEWTASVESIKQSSGRKNRFSHMP